MAVYNYTTIKSNSFMICNEYLNNERGGVMNGAICHEPSKMSASPTLRHIITSVFDYIWNFQNAGI